MKHILILFIFQICFTAYSYGQVTTDCPRIEFTYDAAGNRIQRKWVDCIVVVGGGGGRINRTVNPDGTVTDAAIADEATPLAEGDSPTRDGMVSEIETSAGVLASVSIAPNPTAGILYLNANELQGSLQVTVFDLQGKNLYSGAYSGGTQTIDLSGFPAAPYFLRLQSEAEVKVLKVVKE